MPILIEDLGVESRGCREVHLATRPSASRAEYSDPIRIVPLRADGLLAPAPTAAPSLTYRGGPLLTAVQIFTFFWGDGWQGQPQAGLMAQIVAFFDYVVTSPLIDQLGEYGVAGSKIGHGANLGGSSSCSTFCGYHSDINGQIFYAVMPYPDCTGCTGSLTVLDALTSTTSHELCEAITDPVPGQGWYDDTNGEIGDICAWQTKKLGAYTVQLEWSNQAGRCIRPWPRRVRSSTW